MTHRVEIIYFPKTIESTFLKFLKTVPDCRQVPMEARGGAMKKLWVVVRMPQLQELPYPGQSEYILICRWRVVKDLEAKQK